MLDVVTPEEMARIDGAAVESMAQLIDRAGYAVAMAARRLLGGAYGRHIVVLAGKGNNGADGLAAQHHLDSWGAKCTVLLADDPQINAKAGQIKHIDLIIDAAYGTGFRGVFEPPEFCSAPVVAVDIPSGVDGLTGEVRGRPLAATKTVTFVAPKPGLALWPGAGLSGEIEVVDIGLTAPEQCTQWVEEADLDLWPTRSPQSHKWQSAVWVIGGGPGMTGAPSLAASAAARAGAGYVLISTPPDSGTAPESGCTPAALTPYGQAVGPIEAVTRPLISPWSDEVLSNSEKVGALVMGPGLGIEHGGEVRSVAAGWASPLVLDAGAIRAIATSPELLRQRAIPAILTPHDGEFSALTAQLVAVAGTSERAITSFDRLSQVREAAAFYGAVILLKGPTTIVASPNGRVWLSTAGDGRLATAGTGDVLAGVIGAALALGLTPGLAAALGTELHGRAALCGLDRGLVASDLPGLIAQRLTNLPS